MKKTPVKKRTPTTVKKTAARSTASASTVKKTTPKKTTTKSRAVTKKPVAKKGVKHHAKRLYHVTPKFIHGMVAGALVGVMVVGILSATTVVDPSSANAATKCDAHGIGDRTLTNNTNNTAYKINGNKATVTFDVVGKGCKVPVTMVVWKAPNGTTGKPYSAQTLFRHKSDTFTTGRHTMTATLPACYFQVDTVTGTKLTGSTGQAYNYDSRQVAFMHGGTTSCVKKPTPTPPTPSNPTPPTPTPPAPITVCDLTSHEVVPIDADDFDATLYSKDTANCVPTPEVPPTVTPETPVTTVTPTATTETLPNTGAGAVITIALLSIAGGFLFHKLHHHNKSRRHTR